MIDKKWLIYIVLMMSFLIGCSSSPLARYPDFTERKNTFDSTIILADFITIEALLSDTNKIDIPENKKYAKTCLDFFAGKMNEKGYHVDRSLLTSIGLLMNQNNYNRVVNGPEERNLESNRLNIASPPYYVNEFFSRDTLARKLLFKVYSSLIYYTKEKGEKNINIPAATYLGKIIGGGLIGVVFVSGFHVPAGVRPRLNVDTKEYALDKTTVEVTSQLSMIFYLIDSSTGEIVWDDRILRQGGTFYIEKIIDLADYLINELP